MKGKISKPKMKFGKNEKISHSQRLDIGDTGPDFIGLTKEVTAFEFYKEGKGKLKIINSITSIDTNGGLRQVVNFNEIIPKAKDDFFAVTISADLPFAIERFSSSESVSGSLFISDYRHLDFGRSYGFAIEDTRLLSSGIVVLDRENKVIFIQYMKNPDITPDFERALAAAERILYDETLFEVDKLLYE
ncbi:MAG TPA: redoxin family protein [Clostridia bacterium]|nr:redoxin family protein [Clostridia bacterium]